MPNTSSRSLKGYLSHDGRPLVSVVIPTRDRISSLNCALESVAAQTIASGVEVIVVNDGGPLDSSFVSRWRDRLEIRLIEHGLGSGPAVARNLGVDAVAGAYIAFLDDDDLFLPNHLKTGIQALVTSPAQFVYTGAIVADRRTIADSPGGANRYKAYPYNQEILFVANFIHTGSVIVRNFSDTAVRFDESLSVCEDWDLWLALTVTLGYRVAFIEQITSVYHQIPDVHGLVANAQLTSPSAFSVVRNHIYQKWPSAQPLVCAFRGWMSELERVRDNLIANRTRMPNLLFDAVLAYLHQEMSRERAPDYNRISDFFGSA